MAHFRCFKVAINGIEYCFKGAINDIEYVITGRGQPLTLDVYMVMSAIFPFLQSINKQIKSERFSLYLCDVKFRTDVTVLACIRCDEIGRQVGGSADLVARRHDRT